VPINGDNNSKYGLFIGYGYDSTSQRNVKSEWHGEIIGNVQSKHIYLS
jgi:hypothetical protein